MNIAVIFAGGVGKRMGNTEKPKQFIEIDNKPVIIHTLEVFEKNKDIDVIIVSILEQWKSYFEDLVKKYKFTKIKYIVNGGETGQMSIFNGLSIAYSNYPKESIVLIHDGVRPFINDSLIERNIESVKKNKSAISIVYSTETTMIIDEREINNIPNRNTIVLAKAPQSFVLDDIYNVHILAQKDKFITATDSATLMYKYGKKLSIVETDYDNIKITTPKDIVIAKSIYERRMKKK